MTVEDLRTRLRRGTVSLTVAHNSAVTIGAATQLYLARVVPLGDLGTFAVIAATTDLLMIPLDWSINRALMNRLATTPDPLSARGTAWVLTLIQVALHGLCAAAALVLTLAPREQQLMAATLIATRGITKIGHFCALDSDLRLEYRSIASATIAGAVSGLVAGIGGAFMGLGIWALALKEVAQGAVTTLCQYLLDRPTLQTTFHKNEAAGLAGYASRMMAMNGLERLGSHLDVLVLAAAAPMSTVAVYSYAKKLVGMITNAAQPAVQRVLFAAYAQNETSGHGSTIHSVALRAIVVGGCAVAVLLLLWPDVAIRIVLGPAFVEASAPLRVFATIPLFTILVENDRTRMMAAGLFTWVFTIHGLQLAVMAMLFAAFALTATVITPTIAAASLTAAIFVSWIGSRRAGVFPSPARQAV